MELTAGPQRSPPRTRKQQIKLREREERKDPRHVAQATWRSIPRLQAGTGMAGTGDSWASLSQWEQQQSRAPFNLKKAAGAKGQRAW